MKQLYFKKQTHKKNIKLNKTKESKTFLEQWVSLKKLSFLLGIPSWNSCDSCKVILRDTQM